MNLLKMTDCFKLGLLYGVLFFAVIEVYAAEEDFIFDAKKAESHRFNQVIVDQVIAAGAPRGDDFIELLAKAEKTETIKIQKVAPTTIENPYLYARERTFVFAKPYNCGKCDKWHSSAATAWVISEDGLMVTNYHCFTKGLDEGGAAVSYNLETYPVVEILLTNKAEDFTVFKVKLPEGKKLKAFPLGRPAKPGDSIHLVSNLLKSYYYYSQSYVSGYSMSRGPTGLISKPRLWMHTELHYGHGSSGGAIFNVDGEVVGMVSFFRPKFDNVSKEESEAVDKYAMKLFEYTVPISNIMKRLEFVEE